MPAIFFKWLYSAFVRATSAPHPETIRENIRSVSRRFGWGGNAGTATTPALRHARNATIKSSDGGYTSTALVIRESKKPTAK